ELKDVPTIEDPIFGVHVPREVPGVPTEILVPKNTWKDKDAFERTAKKLASLFRENFKQYEAQASEAIRGAAPRL
ncbi:MAG: phosphoenolpyruvate carboxykinase (ATP), partial [Sandaracinaceae bacterium]|nr:phosphoenolpyruvate carboxykinase (ATP) [Sandaracinaceae bacterium]